MQYVLRENLAYNTIYPTSSARNTDFFYFAGKSGMNVRNVLVAFGAPTPRIYVL
jgi:hypothetical protein